MFNYTSYVLVGVESLYRITDELRTDTGHDHMRRRGFNNAVCDNRADRANDHSDHVMIQFNNEREISSLQEKLVSACHEISYSRGEIATMINQVADPICERKTLMEVLARGGYLPKKERRHSDTTGK